MVRRRCQRCEVIPELSQEAGRVYFTAPLEMLLEKLENLLRQVGCVPQRKREYLSCSVGSFKDFLQTLFRNSSFSGPELEDIVLLFVPQGERLRVGLFGKAQSLGVYFDFLQGEEYLEILREGRLVVYFHPVLEVNTLDVWGYECLIRGIGKDGTLVSPGTLFRFAERTNTLFFFDRLCREMSIKAAAAKVPGEKLIFINFIPGAIYDPRVCLRTTVEWIRQFDLVPQRIVFEVVEMYKIEDLAHLKSVLDYYRGHGFQVALDDVGTGYANLDALTRLVPDIVKIDSNLIRNITQNSVNQRVFHSLTSLARELRIAVLAEGVETEAEFHYVCKEVDLVQGYYFGHPAPEPTTTVAFSGKRCSESLPL